MNLVSIPVLLQTPLPITFLMYLLKIWMRNCSQQFLFLKIFGVSRWDRTLDWLRRRHVKVWCANSIVHLPHPKKCGLMAGYVLSHHTFIRIFQTPDLSHGHFGIIASIFLHRQMESYIHRYEYRTIPRENKLKDLGYIPSAFANTFACTFLYAGHMELNT